MSRRCLDGLRFSAKTRGDVLDDVFRISADAGEKSGRHCVEEEQPDEVQPGLVGDDPAYVDWLVRLLVLTEDRKVDPGEVWAEARAPDDVLHRKDAFVLQDGESVSSADHPADAFDAGERLGRPA